eukprot:TRINITY_DN56942_c0_g1_i1.p1 TRINITY_DN56942_c0_g1~~TRINITY_DN56942_c0_g1_i1.p1  ORF type:complete len:251 (+),score=46.73 TRINITY_DN56942_c0_g1_i1:97-753(+)
MLFCCCAGPGTKAEPETLRKPALGAGSGAELGEGADASAGGFWARLAQHEHGSSVVQVGAAKMLGHLALDPEAARYILRHFAEPALAGMQVQLLRGSGKDALAADARFTLSMDLSTVTFRVHERERHVPLADITRVETAADAPGVQGSPAHIELESGNGVVVLLHDAAARDEFVLCLGLLAEAARGKTLRLTAGDGDAASEQERGSVGADEAVAEPAP